jgi:antitoxin component YwqK of YwqJK toxin-antitoxin module
MKHKLLLLLFLSFQLFGQKALTTGDINIESRLAYKDGKLFTGSTQYTRNTGHVVFIKDYVNGFQTKYTVYFNDNEQNVSTETYYKEKSFLKEKKYEYGYKRNTIEKTFYDDNGKKLLSEIYKDDKLIYSCPYQNGKKNGQEFEVCEKNGETCTVTYANGKKVK